MEYKWDFIAYKIIHLILSEIVFFRPQTPTGLMGKMMLYWIWILGYPISRQPYKQNVCNIAKISDLSKLYVDI